jgi:hypothetical protein
MFKLMSANVSDKARETFGEMFVDGELTGKTKKAIHAQLDQSAGYNKGKGEEIALFVEMLHATITEENLGDALYRRVDSLIQTHTTPTAWESLTVSVEARKVDTQVATAQISAFFAPRATNGAAGILVTALERVKVLTHPQDKKSKPGGQLLIPQAFKVQINTPKKELMDEIRGSPTIKINETMWDLTVHADKRCMVPMRLDPMDRPMQLRIGNTLREVGLTDADIELHLLLHARYSLPKHADNIIAVQMEDTKKVDKDYYRLRPNLIGFGTVSKAEFTSSWEPNVYLVMKTQESAEEVSKDATTVIKIHAGSALQQQGESTLCAKWEVGKMKKDNIGGTGEDATIDIALKQMRTGIDELLQLGESLSHLLN